MSGFSNVTLIGRLGRKPQIKKLEKGKRIALLTVGCYETVPGPNGLVQVPQWHNVVVTSSDFVKKIIEKHYHAGYMVEVSGPLVYRHYVVKDENGKENHCRHAQIMVTEYGRIRNTPRTSAGAIELAEFNAWKTGQKICPPDSGEHPFSAVKEKTHQTPAEPQPGPEEETRDENRFKKKPIEID